jgi:hypothetical protein
MPYDKMADYLAAVTYKGVTYPVLPITNCTRKVGASLWRNVVMLYDRTHASWAVVYDYQYEASDIAQKNGWPGSWGPIIETFQSLYSGTNPLGTLDVRLRADPSGTWTDWVPLSNSESALRADNVGLHPKSIDPNFSWIVVS